MFSNRNFGLVSIAHQVFDREDMGMFKNWYGRLFFYKTWRKKKFPMYLLCVAQATKYFSNALFLLNFIAFHFNCICIFALLIQRLMYVHLHCLSKQLFICYWILVIFWFLEIFAYTWGMRLRVKLGIKSSNLKSKPAKFKTTIDLVQNSWLLNERDSLHIIEL